MWALSTKLCHSCSSSHKLDLSEIIAYSTIRNVGFFPQRQSVYNTFCVHCELGMISVGLVYIDMYSVGVRIHNLYYKSPCMYSELGTCHICCDNLTLLQGQKLSTGTLPLNIVCKLHLYSYSYIFRILTCHRSLNTLPHCRVSQR